MDILQFIIENESSILIIVSVLLAIATRYFQNQSSVLYAAGQAMIDLESAFLEDIKDGVVTKEEADALLVKVEAAKKAILDVIDIFTKPQTLSQKFDILIGASGVREQLSRMTLKTETMKKKRQ
jgi:hypothetical protein